MISWMVLALLPTAALPSYEAGDTFIFTGGRVERVRRVDGEMISWSGRGKASWQRSRNPVVPILGWHFAAGEGRRTIGGTPDSLWPLESGKSSRFRVVTEINRGGKRLRSVALWSCHVGKPATVAVPAGRFDSFPILCERYSPVSMRLAERIRFDWAPDIGHYVRRQSTLYVSGETIDNRLVAALPAESATDARIAALAEGAARE